MTSNPYPKLLLTLAISFVIMYSVMFLNVASAAHIHLSLSRTYMALMMVAPMALLMLLMMGHMYPDKKRNQVIMISSVVVFAGALLLLRAQVPIEDVQYMRAMIPHHSSAILTSEQASITDPEVRELADDIIKAQKDEIAQMEQFIQRLEDQ